MDVGIMDLLNRPLKLKNAVRPEEPDITKIFLMAMNIKNYGVIGNGAEL